MPRSAKEVLDYVMNIFFADNTWHETAAKLKANPIFFGSDLERLALGEDCHQLHLAAASMDWTGDIQYGAKLVDSLKRPRLDSSDGLLRHQRPGPRLTLNIQEDNDDVDEQTRVRAYGSLFCLKSDELTTCVLYYHKGQGFLEYFYILRHQLPWKKQYTIHLQYCFSPNSTKPLEWLVVEDVNIK
ncbi:hypothetical protein BDP55DRAFT_639235 [Colletotrichum godetiae]|uniref:Uncharacterized protein n=1 Tax=Colletotrichum godetiae TaxID=1209918 RepID=A0AAJ0A6P3_9PEZI|nr:uncharacterized protein BDP55DRAFT_639235 [Colletotrichum godetiae]KAK1656888.1 hypothetical protein BDP55DRAFT_639235 [Colletotrichum godetiae]